MTIGCLILNYNDSETTESLLNKIKNYNIIDHIIVVDNKSSDNSYEQLLKHVGPKTTVLLSDRNGGYGYGNNYGIKYAHKDLNITHLIICNPDVEFTEDLIMDMIHEFNINRKLGMCAATPLDRNNKAMNLAWKKPDNLLLELLSNSSICRKIIGTPDRYSEEYFHGKDRVIVDSVPGSMFMIDVRKMIEYGMYDEDIFLYGEEKVLGYKFYNSKIETVVLLNKFYKHYHSVSINKNIPSLFKLTKIGIDSELIILRKYWNVVGSKLIIAKGFLSLVWIERILLKFIKSKL